MQQVLLHPCDVNAIKVHRLEGSLLLELTDTDTAFRLASGHNPLIQQQIYSDHVGTPTEDTLRKHKMDSSRKRRFRVKDGTPHTNSHVEGWKQTTRPS
jgi:hypothetical protein